MVSKVAVMALVAVVAVPILLGYGLNIESETYTSWEPKEGDSINVSDYLYNVTDTSKRNYTVADPYLFNSSGFYFGDAFLYPKYESITSNNSTIPIRAGSYSPTGNNIPIAGLDDDFLQVVMNGGYDANNYYSFKVTYMDSTVETYDHVKMLSWSTSDVSGVISGNATIEYYYSSSGVGVVSLDNVRFINADLIGNSPGYYQEWHSTSMTGYYADLSKGWVLNYDYPVSISSSSNRSHTYIQPDGICKDMVISFNLDSITDTDYWMGVYLGTSTFRYHIQLIKETVSGVTTTIGRDNANYINNFTHER